MSTDFARRMQRNFPEPINRLIAAIRSTATIPVYLVGGPVRDLMLSRTLIDIDIDIVVEGDAPTFVRQLVATYGGTQHTHTRFGTATWQLADTPFDSAEISHIDITTARTETYPAPATLPIVQAAPIADDLRRRDFSINAIALAIHDAEFGRILDLHNGQQHITNRTLHVLHDHSFRDDPTRLQRALRFEQRFDFTLDQYTQDQWQEGLDHIPELTGKRIWNEFEKTFHEPDPAAVMQRLDKTKFLEKLGNDLGWYRFSAEHYKAHKHLQSNPTWQALLSNASTTDLLTILWLHPHPEPVWRHAIDRLRLNHTIPKTLEHLQTLTPTLIKLDYFLPSTIDTMLADYAQFPATLIAARCIIANMPIATIVDKWQQEWRHLKLTVTGNDLRTLGLPPGPAYRPILRQLRNMRLDGTITSAEEPTTLKTLASK